MIMKNGWVIYRNEGDAFDKANNLYFRFAYCVYGVIRICLYFMDVYSYRHLVDRTKRNY